MLYLFYDIETEWKRRRAIAPIPRIVRFERQIPASSAEPFVHQCRRVGFMQKKKKLWYLEIC